jgi:hypothetical protein
MWEEEADEVEPEPSVPYILHAFLARDERSSWELRSAFRRLMLHSLRPISSEFVNTTRASL